MTEPVAAERRRGGVLAVVIGMVSLVVVIFVLPVLVVLLLVKRTIDGDGPPSYDREPVVLEWVEQDGSWWRSETFELVEVSQVVQVDVALWRDGGVLQLGNTVYAVPAGESFPDLAATTSGTLPFTGVRVGHGVEAVNEQITLGTGRWELAVAGGAAPVEVRWPC
jgi:hypothetical protein